MSTNRTDPNLVNDPSQISFLDLSRDNIKQMAPENNVSIDTIAIVNTLSQTCHTLHGLFKQQSDAFPAKITACTAKGEVDKIREIIAKHPDILFRKTAVTDYSGRTFSNISPLQYAAWSLDIDLIKMMMNYLTSDEQQKIALQQFIELEEHGTEHGSHFDLSTLISALQTYLDHYQSWDQQQQKEHWCRIVGGAQRLLPANMVNEYCRNDKIFCELRPYHFDTLPRVLTFHDQTTNTISSWFPLQPNAGVGFDVAVLAIGNRAFGCTIPDATRLVSNIAALTKLRDTKQANLDALIRELSSLFETKDDPKPGIFASCTIS